MEREGRDWRYKWMGLAAAVASVAVAFSGCQPELIWERLAGGSLAQEDSRPEQEEASAVREMGEASAVSGKMKEEAAHTKELSLEEVETAGIPSFLYEGGSYYAYEGLGDAEKLWYRDMEQILGTLAEGVKLSEEGLQAGLDEGVVDRIFQCVLCDHPELFYVDGYTYVKYTREGKTVAIEFSGTYSASREGVEEKRRQIEGAIAPILQGAPVSGTDYEKVRYVYETLVLRTDYNVQSEENQNIYSVFVNGESVCQGYAKAAQYLLNRLGLFCTLVQGRVLETGEGHAWNLVELDGEYYYMDPTWGDISYQHAGGVNAKLPQISYDYLCVTTEQIQRTHQIEGPVEMPVCTAVEDNYYVQENALFTAYDEVKLAALAERAREAGREELALRCASEACYRKMREKLVDQQEIFRYLTGADSFAYTENDKQWTLTFFMVTSE